MKMKPFNLEEALSGASVVTREGLKVTELHLFKDSTDMFRLFGVVHGLLFGGNIKRFTTDGTGSESIFDLFMKIEHVIINGIECPAPEVNTLPTFRRYYVPDIASPDMYSSKCWMGEKVDIVALERGLVFEKRKDAIATTKAILAGVGIKDIKE